LNNMTQWIVDNQETYNIQLVTHVGDLVQDDYHTDEWQTINESMMILYNNDVPYGWCAGNHDDDNWIANNYEAFDVSDLEVTKTYWGGDYGNGKSNYQLLNISGMDFIFIHITYQGDSALTWASNLLSTYSDHRAIITTHAYITFDGTFGGYGDTSWNADLNDTVSAHSNVFMVICGHYCGGAIAYNDRDHGGGRTVYELMFNWQCIVNGGDGWLGMITFYPHNNSFETNAISPYLTGTAWEGENQWNNDYYIIYPDQDHTEGNDSRVLYTNQSLTEDGFDHHRWLDYDMDYIPNYPSVFDSINNQANNTIILEENRWFNWTKDSNASIYSIRIANDSNFADVFFQLDNITITDGWCTNSFLNTSSSASPYAYNYWEDSSYCYFHLSYSYNITFYDYHYYQVRSYGTQ